jgi:hypothetical protein
VKSAAHDSDHGVGFSIELEASAQHLSPPPETVAPESLIEKNHSLSTVEAVLRRETTPEGRFDSQDSEHIGRQRSDHQVLRVTGVVGEVAASVLVDTEID